MKPNIFTQLSNGWRRLAIGSIALLFVMTGMDSVLAGSGAIAGTNASIDDQVIAELKSKDYGHSGAILEYGIAHRKQVVQSLLAIMKDPQASRETKGCAAYYISAHK
jgi:hypothetical protein